MNQAEKVRDQVLKGYPDGFNTGELISHLAHDFVDYGVEACVKFAGFDKADGLLALYYHDGSILTVAECLSASKGA